MIELKDIRKAFNTGRENEFHALNGIDLHLPTQRVTAFCGPSGSGKTTLLSIIGYLSRPTSGRVRLGDRDISGLPERFLTDIRRQTFSFIFQPFNLIKDLSARENVMLPAYPLGGNWRALHERAESLLGELHLAHRFAAAIEHLSGGEQQRVAIARALINDPQIIIADEPTANLDTALAMEFMAILEKLHGIGKTVILTSHDPLVVDSAIIHQVIDIRDGRIVTPLPIAVMLFQPVIIALLNLHGHFHGPVMEGVVAADTAGTAAFHESRASERKLLDGMQARVHRRLLRALNRSAVLAPEDAGTMTNREHAGGRGGRAAAARRVRSDRPASPAARRAPQPYSLRS